MKSAQDAIWDFVMSTREGSLAWRKFADAVYSALAPVALAQFDVDLAAAKVNLERRYGWKQ
jgi:hypothetical protein